MKVQIRLKDTDNTVIFTNHNINLPTCVKEEFKLLSKHRLYLDDTHTPLLYKHRDVLLKDKELLVYLKEILRKLINVNYKQDDDDHMISSTKCNLHTILSFNRYSSIKYENKTVLKVYNKNRPELYAIVTGSEQGILRKRKLLKSYYKLNTLYISNKYDIDAIYDDFNEIFKK